MNLLVKFLLLAALGMGAAAAGAQNYVNYDLPQNPDTLRILGIGNSFTEDGMMYLPELLKEAGINNVVVARMVIGGQSVEQHYRLATGNTARYDFYKSTENTWVKAGKPFTLKEGIGNDKWDVVVLQQVSGKSGAYQTYQPWLNKLIEFIRLNGKNAGACIAWQQTWAYARKAAHPEFARYEKNQTLMYRSINQAVKEMMNETGIDVVIPTGTAIQNLRNTAHNDSLDVTRDGYHLSLDKGRYLAACTWFQALIAPGLKTNIQENTYRLKGTPNEISEEEARACRLAATRACIRLFEVWKEE